MSLLAKFSYRQEDKLLYYIVEVDPGKNPNWEFSRVLYTESGEFLVKNIVGGHKGIEWNLEDEE